MVGIFLITSLLVIMLVPLFIKLSHTLKFYQFVRDEGPKSHLSKSNTITMGGILFIFITIVVYVIYSAINGVLTMQSYLIIYMTLAFSVIGFLDDFLKIFKKSPYGLKARESILLQIIFSIPFILFSLRFKNVSFSLIILGLFNLLVILATANSVNLTDGLDGLLAGVSIPIFIFYFLISKNNNSISYFSIAFAGSLLGFLFFNFYPAKIFMGNVGSFAIGGAISALAILTNTEPLLLVLGGIFVIEALSVIIQVSYFKYTKKKYGEGKRVFLMSPIHHHFELKGLPEPLIVVRAWIIQVIIFVISFILINFFTIQNLFS
ncbi:MAG: phospho-N-acetylmuramoyl-pentapeptide-transferase [Caldisericia bacterium]|nr:phospho-N-acetylmuramoyl-pentapeptide-transferase [Caldisericia bacterium]